MSDDRQFEPLLETTDPVELGSVKSLLEGAGIAYLVQAEHHHQLAGGLFGNPAIAPRVLVKRDDLERARGLLAARPAPEEVCAVHEKPATSRCSACDSALCADCSVSGTPPVCESCAVRPPVAREVGQRRVRTARKVVALMMLAPLAFALASLVVVALARLAGVLPLGR